MNYPSLLLCISVSALISIGLPVALLIFWRKKTHASLFPVMIGAATFILFALVLEQLLHSVVLKIPAVTGNTVIYVLYAGFAAGIFEETGRWFAFRFLLKKYRDRETSVTYGIGHGGIEAILVTGAAMLSNLALVILLATQGESALIAAVGGDTASTLISTFRATAPSLYLVGGLERVTAIALHIALSVLVFRAVREHRIGDWLLAILFHALVDCFAVLYSVGVIDNILVIELGILLMTVGIALVALQAYRAMAPSSEEEAQMYGPEEGPLPEENEQTYEPEELFPTGDQSVGPEELFPTEGSAAEPSETKETSAEETDRNAEE
ncbi:MAG TPA: YhfC family intramembrane metalloprotease [Oscillospiraceae bacterium]|nr:YhfC family intramembrane metalloprotease [Oscillospiraceae bacterium]HXK77422.1 YhfC family intramembrane metalloprotease [Oscillospiraceae bacterium]